MRAFTVVSTTAVAFTCFFQPCPAPPVLAAIGMSAGEAAGVAGGLGGGAIAGGISKGAKMREDTGLPAAAMAACNQQLRGVTVRVSKLGNDNVCFDSVPPACMTLANVFLGPNEPEQAHPIPMGSDSLQYNGLTSDEMKKLEEALDTVQHV